MNEFGNNRPNEWQGWEDRPEINFEIRNDYCKLRAEQFAEQTDRLTIDREIDENGRSDELARRYYLDDGDTLDVNHESYPDGEGSMSVVVWTKAPYVVDCSDGQRRRAVCSRTYTFDNTPDIDMDPEELAELDEAVQEAMQELEKSGLKRITPEEEKEFGDMIRERNFHIAMGDMEIPENISMRTKTTVELQLPNSPNYTSEHLVSPEKELIHLDVAFAGEAHTGFRREETGYSPREHEKLMDILSNIDPTETPPVITSFE